MGKELTKFKNIIFDCDSTLVKIEGLLFVAAQKGLAKEVAAVTEAGMNGEISFRESLSRRLELLNLVESDLKAIERGYVQNLTEGALEVVRSLRQRDQKVFILSGAFRPPVQGLATFLGVARENVLAIPITVDFRGRVHISEEELNRVDQLKSEAVKRIRQSGPTVLVGDGMTDWEAGQAADLFIGFGGVVFRPKLKSLVPIYLEEPGLQRILDIV